MNQMKEKWEFIIVMEWDLCVRARGMRQKQSRVDQKHTNQLTHWMILSAWTNCLPLSTHLAIENLHQFKKNQFFWNVYCAMVINEFLLFSIWISSDCVCNENFHVIMCRFRKSVNTPELQLLCSCSSTLDFQFHNFGLFFDYFFSFASILKIRTI